MQLLNIKTLDIDQLGQGKIVPILRQLPMLAPILWVTKEEALLMFAKANKEECTIFDLHTEMYHYH